jgi:hypothetical protein
LLPVAEEEEKDEALYSMNDLEVLDYNLLLPREGDGEASVCM